MPPKNKNEKAVEAEMKKKDTAEAKSIVAFLKGETSKSGRAPKASTKKPASETKKEKLLQPKEKSQRVAVRNSSDNAKKLANATSTSMNTDSGFPNPDSNDFTGETSSTSREKPVVIQASKRGYSQSKEKSQRVADRNLADNAKKLANATSTSTNTDGGFPNPDSNGTGDITGEMSSLSREKRLVVQANSKIVIPTPKSTQPKDAAYHYEIDCNRVADSIDVTDVKRFLEKQLKVDGKKDNLTGSVSIHCEGQKAIIKSHVYMPKKSLRFLSKKFLKKNWNIQVVSKNVHSYEYKYVGTL